MNRRIVKRRLREARTSGLLVAGLKRLARRRMAERAILWRTFGTTQQSRQTVPPTSFGFGSVETGGECFALACDPPEQSSMPQTYSCPPPVKTVKLERVHSGEHERALIRAMLPKLRESGEGFGKDAYSLSRGIVPVKVPVKLLETVTVRVPPENKPAPRPTLAMRDRRTWHVVWNEHDATLQRWQYREGEIRIGADGELYWYRSARPVCTLSVRCPAWWIVETASGDDSIGRACQRALIGGAEWDVAEKQRSEERYADDLDADTIASIVSALAKWHDKQRNPAVADDVVESLTSARSIGRVMQDTQNTQHATARAITWANRQYRDKIAERQRTRNKTVAYADATGTATGTDRIGECDGGAFDARDDFVRASIAMSDTERLTRSRRNSLNVQISNARANGQSDTAMVAERDSLTASLRTLRKQRKAVKRFTQIDRKESGDSARAIVGIVHGRISCNPR